MTIKIFPVFIFLLASGFAASAPAQDGHDHRGAEEGALKARTDNHEELDEHREHAIVPLTAAELEEFGVEVTAAAPGVIETYLELPGEVRPNADRLAHIVPRYSGIVTDVRANIGQHVKEGQVLAVIESDESLAPFEVKTLISGTIIGKHITLGEAASRDRNIFIIADLSAVWIDLTVYQRDLSRVKEGQPAAVYVGHDLAEANGTISYITPVVDEHTRTATARLVLPNKRNQWRPGMFVTARVLVEKIEVPLVVPRTALQTFHGRSVVFLETEGGFKPQPITIGRGSETDFEVLSGLSLGDHYVSEGGFTLKAELEKGSFGDGHAH